MKEKTIDLENGYELVVEGNFDKYLNYEHEIYACFGGEGTMRLFVRKKVDK